MKQIIRKPLQTLYSNKINGTATSSVVFTLGVLDFDSLVFKLSGNPATGGSMDCFIQTTDDGGTTWFDLLHFPTVSGTTPGVITNASAYWAAIPMENAGAGTMIGKAGNGNLGATGANYAGGVTSLPILSPTMNLNYTYTKAGTNITGASWVITVYGQNQSGVGY